MGEDQAETVRCAQCRDTVAQAAFAVDVLGVEWLGVQIRAADTRAHEVDQRIGRILENRVRHVVDTNFTGAVHVGRSHEHLLRG